MLLGALEAGGTKMVCAVGDETGAIHNQISIPTETPEITIPKLIVYFKQYPIEALGIASFGPVDLNPASPTYGYITTTPKPGWGNYNLKGAFEKELRIPIGFDTDVNGSALGEQTFGCMKGIDCGIYLTVGTGIGMGVIANGHLLHGMLHSEAGHILLSKHPEDTFAGKCPFHPNCLEGLAAGPAIEARWGRKAVELKDDKKVWELEAYYLAQALVDYILVLSPQKIVLGGGVMHQLQLFPLIRAKVKELLNGYIKTKELADIDNYIVPASLNDDQGIMGCLQLAVLACK
ncbi:MAG: ROK family protein [Lachnospiraceae bacterium]|nr:ROK family protein [Lachnospiraceae bacterium]